MKEMRGRGTELQWGILKHLKVMEMFIIFILVMVLWLYTIINTYQIVHSKYMESIICQHINKHINK